MNTVDNPRTQDNRNYIYNESMSSSRSEYKFIADLIEPGSKVIDLGCGDGALLELLIKRKNVRGKGLEISQSGVELCKKKHLDVMQGEIDALLPYNDSEFDYSICNVTIQMVKYPEVLLKEMQRISKYQVISFPNFGYFKNRVELLFKGKMPGKMLFGYKWYNTGHIHQLSVKDFYDLLNDVENFKIIEKITIPSGSKLIDFLAGIFPGMFGKIILFRVTGC